jgi:hypothetical protein
MLAAPNERKRSSRLKLPILTSKGRTTLPSGGVNFGHLRVNLRSHAQRTWLGQCFDVLPFAATANAICDGKRNHLWRRVETRLLRPNAVSSAAHGGSQRAGGFLTDGRLILNIDYYLTPPMQIGCGLTGDPEHDTLVSAV